MLGGQCGLTPDQVLDMNIPMVRAMVEGYQEHLFDLQCLAVHQGHWAGYFQSKKPKPASSILEKMERDHRRELKRAKSKGKSVAKPEVNVDQFLQREQRRMAFMARKSNRMR